MDSLARLHRDGRPNAGGGRFDDPARGRHLFIHGCDLDLRYTWVSHPIHGLTAAGMLGRRDDEILPPDAAAALVALKRRALETGKGQSAEIEIPLSDGTRLFEVAVEPARDPEGRIASLTVAAFDLTGRRAAEQALRESEARLELATSAAGIGIWDWDLLTNRFVYSDRAKAICGLPPDHDVTHEDTKRLTHPEDHPQTSAAARRALDPAIRERPVYEYRIVRPDGAVRRVLAHGEAIFAVVDGEERAVRYVGTLQDVTERWRLQEERAASEARLRLAIDAGRMAVWEVDLVEDTVVGSTELNRLLGFPEDANPTLQEMRARYYPGERDRLLAIGQAALERGERFMEAEYRYVWPDGSLRWLLLRAEFHLDADGNPVTAVGVLMDITDRKHTEERQQLLLDELNHRVKNTLAMVQSLARQTQRSTPSPEAFREAFEARLMALSMAHDLLTRSNWEGARLRDIVEAELAPYRGRGGASGRVVLRGCAVRLPPRTALTLAMVFHELATNAAKYGALSSPQGTVRVTWQISAGETRPKVTIDWVESGGPPVAPPKRRGFGSQLIGRSVGHELDGQVCQDFDVGGLRCRLVIPLPGGGNGA